MSNKTLPGGCYISAAGIPTDAWGIPLSDDMVAIAQKMGLLPDAKGRIARAELTKDDEALLAEAAAINEAEAQSLDHEQLRLEKLATEAAIGVEIERAATAAAKKADSKTTKPKE